MPTKRTPKPPKKIHPHHISDMPDHGVAIMQGIVDILMPLCPGCRLEMLAFINSMMIKQITPEQQRDYLKELMRSTYYEVMKPEEPIEKQGTIH